MYVWTGGCTEQQTNMYMAAFTKHIDCCFMYVFACLNYILSERRAWVK